MAKQMKETMENTKQDAGRSDTAVYDNAYWAEQQKKTDLFDYLTSYADACTIEFTRRNRVYAAKRADGAETITLTGSEFYDVLENSFKHSLWANFGATEDRNYAPIGWTYRDDANKSDWKLDTSKQDEILVSSQDPDERKKAEFMKNAMDHMSEYLDHSFQDRVDSVKQLNTDGNYTFTVSELEDCVHETVFRGMIMYSVSLNRERQADEQKIAERTGKPMLREMVDEPEKVVEILSEMAAENNSEDIHSEEVSEEEYNAMEDVQEIASSRITAVENGMYHYEGPLGTFDYDPTQFEVQRVSNYEVPGTNTTIQASVPFDTLHYIGKETEGYRIKVPYGLQDATNLFAGTSIKSAPQLPNTVEYCNMAFAGCKDLKSGLSVLPMRARSFSYMFANCTSLEQGPLKLPNDAVHADMMFAGCENLKALTRLNDKLKDATGMYAGCKSVEGSLVMPKGIKFTDFMTEGAGNIKMEDDQYSKSALELKRAAYEQKMSKPAKRTVFATKVASGVSACMQLKAARQMGYGLLVAPFAVHNMRKSGMFGKHIGDAMSAITATKDFSNMKREEKSNVKDEMLKKQTKLDADRAEISRIRQESRFDNAMAKFDKKHKISVNGLVDERERTAKDIYRFGASGHLYRQISRLDEDRARERISTDRMETACKMLDQSVANMITNGNFTDANKKYVGSAYLDLLRGIEANYNARVAKMDYTQKDAAKVEQGRSLLNLIHPGRRHYREEQGLRRVTAEQLDVYASYGRSLQMRYGLFSNEQLEQMQTIIDKLPHPGSLDDFKDRYRRYGTAMFDQGYGSHMSDNSLREAFYNREHEAVETELKNGKPLIEEDRKVQEEEKHKTSSYGLHMSGYGKNTKEVTHTRRVIPGNLMDIADAYDREQKMNREAKEDAMTK